MDVCLPQAPQLDLEANRSRHIQSQKFDFDLILVSFEGLENLVAY
jgi:hypothetical protein